MHSFLPVDSKWHTREKGGRKRPMDPRQQGTNIFDEPLAHWLTYCGHFGKRDNRVFKGNIVDVVNEDWKFAKIENSLLPIWYYLVRAVDGLRGGGAGEEDGKGESLLAGDGKAARPLSRVSGIPETGVFAIERRIIIPWISMQKRGSPRATSEKTRWRRATRGKSA